MNYKSFNLGDWISHISGVIEDETTLDGNEMRDLVAFLSKMPKWIPVSERLPEDGEVILFSTKTDRVFEGRYFADNTGRQWYAFRDETFAWNNVVIAWMPLPEPYKTESEDKE